MGLNPDALDSGHLVCHVQATNLTCVSQSHLFYITGSGRPVAESKRHRFGHVGVSDEAVPAVCSWRSQICQENPR